jgi:lysyl-tRNA synthetase class 2
MAEAIAKYNPRYPLHELQKPDYLRVALAPLDIEVFPTDGIGLLQLKLFEQSTESKLTQPTFIVAHPTDVSPLARRNDANPSVTDRFELFIAGREIANGFSELNDPEDQSERLRHQAESKASGDEEAMFYDADYVRALEYGLPPTAGEGIGVDRLVMLLTDSPSIRDVILFPQMRPE